MANSEAPEPKRIYSQEEVQQILNLAIASHQASAQQAYEGEFSRTQLLEIAEDLAIPAAIVHQAEQDWLQAKDESLKREAFNQHQRAELKGKVGRFTIINGGLILLNTLMGFGFPWSLYILLFWGLFLGLKAWNILHLDGEAYEKAFQRWYRTHKVRSVINRWLDRLLSA